MTLLILISTFIISFTITIIFRRIALQRKLLDIPNIRSSHTQPTPRGGGLAIVLSWYIGLIGLRYLELIEPNLFYALISGAILAIVSFLDDLYDIKPHFRILFQFVTVILGICFIGGFRIIYTNGYVLNYPFIFSCIAIIGVMWFINLYNFLDGIDGYASTEAIAVLLGMFIIVKNPIFLLLIFAVLGFLIWNWPKAKIFMGDTGSTQLGYVLIILGIYFNNSLKINFAGWLILTSLFWFDATLTLFYRWRNKEKLSQAHRKHYYQRIVQYGYSHQKVVVISIIINLAFVAIVLASEKVHISYLITLPLCILINIFIACLIDRRLAFKAV